MQGPIFPHSFFQKRFKFYTCKAPFFSTHFLRGDSNSTHARAHFFLPIFFYSERRKCGFLSRGKNGPWRLSKAYLKICFSVLQLVAVGCRLLAVFGRVLQCSAVCCTGVQSVAVCLHTRIHIDTHLRRQHLCMRKMGPWMC